MPTGQPYKRDDGKFAPAALLGEIGESATLNADGSISWPFPDVQVRLDEARRSVMEANDVSGPAKPEPEVLEKPKRRRYSAEYKLRILKEADACTKSGDLGALLRREGLYSSLLSNWRRLRDSGALSGLKPKRRGRKAKPKDPAADELKRLQIENDRLAERLRQAEAIIEVQKKLSEVLGRPLNGKTS